MSNLKRYLPISIAYLFLNLFVFIFWWVVTDSGNYIWLAISPEKKAALESACTRLFLIKYYIWTILLNGLLTAIILIDKKRITALLIVCFSALFYVAGTYVFESHIGQNYYVIFLNQEVTSDFEMEPVHDAGISIGPYLMYTIEEKSSPSRGYAARGLGEIQYVPSISVLASMLNDRNEDIHVRAEAFIALKKMKRTSSRKVLENFSRQQHAGKYSDSLLLETIHTIELHDIY